MSTASMRTASLVALLAEGVDRNVNMLPLYGVTDTVALLAEGVDRNIVFLHLKRLSELSPSSRRAWIEIGQSL